MKIHLNNGNTTFMVYADIETPFVRGVISGTTLTLFPLKEKPAGKVVGRVCLISEKPSGERLFQLPVNHKLPKFGKTAFEGVVDDKGVITVDLTAPLENLRPLKGRGQFVKKKLSLTDAQIADAVKIINSLSREEYRVSLDTTSKEIIIERVTTFR